MLIDGKPRCSWCGSDPLYVAYHDTEWGVPLRDDRALFELLCLEGQQAGLSWFTVLKKRQRYREQFAGFDPHRIAAFDDARLAEILLDPGVIRNRLKIHAIRRNARAALALWDADGGFSGFLWSFARTASEHVGRANQASAIPTATPASEAMSKALKKRGFTFVGSTICYAFMQACGMVDDHSPECWRSLAGTTAGSGPFMNS